MLWPIKIIDFSVLLKYNYIFFSKIDIILIVVNTTILLFKITGNKK